MALRRKKAKRRRKGDLKNVLIVAKQNKAGIKHARKLAKLLEEHVDVDYDRSTALRLRKAGTAIRKFRGDIIITVGGDGTFLMTAHQARVPILPVRIEGRGFLCTCDFKELVERMPRLLAKNYTVRERMRLKCTRVLRRKIEKYMDRIRHSDYPLAANEIAFARKRPSKIIRIDVRIDDQVLDYTGDGVMFYTPAGSTAYAASAGGAILDPRVEAIGIVPLYPFFSKIKPIVIPADAKAEIDIKGGDCALVIDGHGGDYVKSDSSFLIERAAPVLVAQFDDSSFYQRLKAHLIE